MVKRTVVWTETAARQRRDILEYWVKRNGTTNYAEKLIKLTAEQIKVIQSNPKLFKKQTFPILTFQLSGTLASFINSLRTIYLSLHSGITDKIQKNSLKSLREKTPHSETRALTRNSYFTFLASKL